MNATISPSIPEARYQARVLVIDDNRVDSAFLAEMLRTFGCQADISAQGYAAVEQLDRGYDLIFLDIHMPELSGIDIASGLRSGRSIGRPVPIILISGDDFSPGLEDQCMRLGVEGYIQKPVRKEELASILMTYLCEHEVRLFHTRDGTRRRGFIKLKRSSA